MQQKNNNMDLKGIHLKKLVPYFLPVIIIDKVPDDQSFYYPRFNHVHMIICNMCKDYRLDIDSINKKLLECGRYRENLQKVEYVDIINKDMPMPELIHHLYCAYIRNPKKMFFRNAYSHFMWFKINVDKLILGQLTLTMGTVFKSKLLVKFKSNNNYPEHAVVNNVGFNFLTEEMICTDSQEEYNVVLDPLL